MLNLPENIENIINEFVTGVQQILQNRLNSIILYGSYARGDYNNDSDIDIMILTDLKDEEMFGNEEKIVELAYDIESKYSFEIHLSPLLKNIDRYNYWLDTIPFYMNVEKEGVILNG